MDNVNKEEIIDFLKKQKKYLLVTYNLKKIGLFGSFANESNNNNSDIDLIVEFEQGTEDIYSKKQSLKNLLSLQFHRSVDVATENYLKPYYKEHILKQTVYV